MTFSAHLTLLMLFILFQSDANESAVVKRDAFEDIKNGTLARDLVVEKSFFGGAEERNLEQEIMQELNHLSSRKQREIFDDLEKQNEKFVASNKSLVLTESDNLSPLNVEELRNIRKTIKASNSTLPAIRNKRTLNFLLGALAKAMGYTLTPSHPDAEWIPKNQPPPPPQPQPPSPPCQSPASPCHPSGALVQAPTIPPNQIDVNTISYPYRPARTIPLFNFAPLPAGIRVPYPPLLQSPLQRNSNPCAPPPPPPCTPAPPPCTPPPPPCTPPPAPPCGKNPAPPPPPPCNPPPPPPCNPPPPPPCNPPPPPPCKTPPAPPPPPPCNPPPPPPPPPCKSPPAPSPPPCNPPPPPPCGKNPPPPPPPPCNPPPPPPPPPCKAPPAPAPPPCNPPPPPPCKPTPAPPPPCNPPPPPCNPPPPPPPPCKTPPMPPCPTPAPPPPPPCAPPAAPPCGNPPPPPPPPPPSPETPKKGAIFVEYDDPIRIQIFSNDKKYLPASGNIFSGHDDGNKEEWHSYFFPENEKSSQKGEDFEEKEETEEEHIEEEEDEEPGQLKHYEEEDEKALAKEDEDDEKTLANEEDESETNLSLVKKPVDQDVRKLHRRRLVSSKIKTSVTKDTGKKNEKENENLTKSESGEKPVKMKKPKRKKWVRIVKKQRRKTKSDTNPQENFQISTSDSFSEGSNFAPKFYGKRESQFPFDSYERDFSGDSSDDSASHSSEDVPRKNFKKVIVNKKEQLPGNSREVQNYEFNFNPYALEPEAERRKKLEKAVEKYVEDYVEKQLGEELIKNTGVPKTTVFEFTPKNGPKIQTITTTVAKTSHPGSYKPQLRPDTSSHFKDITGNVHFK